MRFGGHETFPVREGWLHKGLVLLSDRPHLQADPFVADHLGVGRNMAKSIWHWLKVTGLVDIIRYGKTRLLRVSKFGHRILARDPYFQETATWWVLHANIVAQTGQARTWTWFFNEFASERFDRALCLEQLVRKLELEGQRMPSRATLTRDVQCLLQSYARPIPAENDDPEEANESPFRDLGLMVHHRDTGTFSMRRGAKDIPPEMIGYIASVAGDDGAEPSRHRIPMKTVLTAPGLPGRVLGLSAEGLAALLHSAESMLGSEIITARALAGERVLELAPLPPDAWLEQMYRRIAAQ